MKKTWIVLLIVVVIVAFGFWRAGQTGVTLEVIQPIRADLRAVVQEQAVTELPQDYLIATPIGGWLQPITLREGDEVKKGQVVARLDTADLEDRVKQIEHRIASLETRIRETEDHRLENNALIEVEATVKSFDETVQAAEAKLQAAKAVSDFAESEVQRVRNLHQTGAAPEKELREYEMQWRKAKAEYQSDYLELAALKTLQAVSYIGPKFIHDYIDRKSFKMQTYRQQREEAAAELGIAKRNLQRAQIESDVDGVVLNRHQTRRQYLMAGTPLLTVGRLDDMEIIAEVLTQRATRIERGDPVDVFGEAIVDGPIQGKVARVYPAGFRKISSLGVEQQRVKVAVKLDQRPARLGVGFRVDVRIYYDEAEDALTLPRTALFRGENGRWQVMAVRDGVAEQQVVTLGLMNDERAQIMDGLSESDRVIARPSRDVTAGTKIKAGGD
jgi:HlyD family secretion protein